MSRVDVEGLPQVLAALTALAAAVDHEAADVAEDAADTIAARVRTLLPLGPPAHGHAKIGGVSVERDGLTATVAEGSVRFPYVAWLDFGGNVGRRHAVHRTYLRRGRYLFPTAAAVRPTLPPAMHLALREAARETGWNPSG